MGLYLFMPLVLADPALCYCGMWALWWLGAVASFVEWGCCSGGACSLVLWSGLGELDIVRGDSSGALGTNKKLADAT